MNSYRSGKWAEFLARLYLRLHGYRIVAKNIIVGRGTTAGEIDIIACKHKCLVFVEVKKRRTLDEAAYAITLKQRQRLIKGAAVFAGNHPKYRGCDIRFDAILVKLPFSIKHLPNAWIA